MANNTTSVPEGYDAAIPMLAVHDAAGAIDFYRQAFGATESDQRYIEADGKIGHAEISIGRARIMLADEFPEHNRSPRQLGGTTVIIHVYVTDLDALFSQATAAGAKVIRPIVDGPGG